MTHETKDYTLLDEDGLFNYSLALNQLKKVSDNEFIRTWCRGELEKIKKEKLRRKKKPIIRADYDLDSLDIKALCKIRVDLLLQHTNEKNKFEKAKIGYKSGVINQELFKRTQNPIYKPRNSF